jgi:hypothetical protein
MGIVPAGEAFLAFGHPAVVTVAVVLVAGQADSHFALSYRRGNAADPLILVAVIYRQTICKKARFTPGLFICHQL